MVSAKVVERIARKFHRICDDHQDAHGDLLTAFVWTAVSLANWLGMTPDDFLSTFGKTFRIAAANCVSLPDGVQPTIIGGGGDPS